MDDQAISYDNNIFFPYDVFGDGNCFCSLSVNSDFIPHSDSKILCPDWTTRTKSLLNVSKSPEGCQLRNYIFNNVFSSSGTIDHYVHCIMRVDEKLASTFEMIYVNIINSFLIVIMANIKGGFMIYNTVRSLNAC